MARPEITAFKLLRAKGRADGTLRRPSLDQVPGATPWAPVDSDPSQAPIVAQDVHLVVFSTSSMSDEAAQALAEGSTAMAIIAALELPTGIEPLIGDLLEVGADRYIVLRVDPLHPSGVEIMFTLSLKAR